MQPIGKNNLAILLQDFEQITDELKPNAYYDEKITNKKLSTEEEMVLSYVLDNQPVHADRVALFLNITLLNCMLFLLKWS